jgi:hypothetical protein
MDSKRGGHEKIERYRDFFDLQLRFAEAVAEKTSTPIADTVLLSTNFHRRFGLGDAPADDAPGPAWQAYAPGSRLWRRISSARTGRGDSMRDHLRSSPHFPITCSAALSSMPAPRPTSFAFTSTAAMRWAR